MRLFSSGWLSRLAPLTVVAALFLFAAFLYPQQIAPGSLTAIDTVAGSSHVAHTYKGETEDGHPAGSLSYPNVSLEETESTDKQPVNAGILTTLLLGAFSGLLFLVAGGGRTYSRHRLTLLLERRLPSLIPRFGQKPSTSLLEVFRL